MKLKKKIKKIIIYENYDQNETHDIFASIIKLIEIKNAQFNSLGYVNSIITNTSEQNQERKFHLFKLFGRDSFKAKQLDGREENIALKLQ